MSDFPALILGLGNVLCSDDGAGVATVGRIAHEWEPPPGLRIVDGGTLGLALLPLLQESKIVILIDAVTTPAPPGTLVRFEGADVGAVVQHSLSVHQVGVADLLGAIRLMGQGPEHLVLHGVVPGELGIGIGCSAPVRASLPELARRVVAEAARLGFGLTPRRHDGPLVSAHRTAP